MPCFNFQCTKPKEIVINLLDFLTDESQMGTGKAWKLKDIAQPSDFTDKCILMANGDGKDEIYVGISLKTDKDYGQEDIRFNGYAGYDEGLKWEEQPGVIYHATLPVIPLPRNAKFVCWVTANSRRFILVVQVSTQYESAYVGFLKPISVERQYPYPLVVAGSAYDGVRWDSYADSHSCWTNPHGSGYNTSFRLRRSDGTWESGLNTKGNQTTSPLAVWPQNTSPTNILTVLDESLTIENIAMYPEYVYECGSGPNTKNIGSDPIGIVGQLDGVYFVGNREDLSSKDTLIYNNKPYMVFNNVDRRDNDEYFCIEWF